MSHWFRIDRGNGELLEGRKVYLGDLEIAASFDGEVVAVTIPREHVEKLIQWLLKAYPDRKDKVVKLIGQPRE